MNESDLRRYLSFTEIAPRTIRAARNLLRLEQAELAKRAHVSVVTIRRLEAANGGERVMPMTVQDIRQALEQAGAEFIPDCVGRRRAARTDARTLYDDLRTVSLRSAARLQGHEQLTEADLYDEDGLPT